MNWGIQTDRILHLNLRKLITVLQKSLRVNLNNKHLILGWLTALFHRLKNKY